MTRSRIQFPATEPTDAAKNAKQSKLLVGTTVSNTASTDVSTPDKPRSAVADEVLLFTINQTCKALSLSRTQIYRLIGAGLLPLKKIGAASRVPASAVRAFAALPATA